MKPFEAVFHAFIDQRYPDVIHEIDKSKELPDSIAMKLDQAAKEAKQQFLSGVAA